MHPLKNSPGEDPLQVNVTESEALTLACCLSMMFLEGRRSTVRMRSSAFAVSCANCGDDVIRNSARCFASDNAVQVQCKSKLVALQNLTKS
jgi:hypothetical protein